MTIALQPATAPIDALFPPASAQAMLNFISAYTQISGLESLTGIIIGSTAPSASDRDKAWLKQDPATGRSLGFYSFVGGSWTILPTIAPKYTGNTPPASPQNGEMYFDTIKNQVFFWDGSAWGNNFYTTGTTANRPVNPVINTLYFDTDISCFIRYDSQGWTTLDGHIGDIKIVDYPDMTDALLMNPGWAEFTAMSSKVPLGQNNGTYGPQDEGNFTFVTSVTPTTDLQYKAMIFLRKEF